MNNKTGPYQEGLWAHWELTLSGKKKSQMQWKVVKVSITASKCGCYHDLILQKKFRKNSIHTRKVPCGEKKKKKKPFANIICAGFYTVEAIWEESRGLLEQSLQQCSFPLVKHLQKPWLGWAGGSRALPSHRVPVGWQHPALLGGMEHGLHLCIPTYLSVGHSLARAPFRNVRNNCVMQLILRNAS